MPWLARYGLNNAVEYGGLFTGDIFRDTVLNAPRATYTEIQRRHFSIYVEMQRSDLPHTLLVQI